jgi:perosamine synthetase
MIGEGDDMAARRTIHISVPSTGEEEWLACRESLISGWVTQGPEVSAFEQAFAERHRVAQALATTSGTTALHLILAALGIGPGDEVVVPSFTWVATANAVLYCGATPIVADVDPATYNIDLNDLERRISARTRAVIAVHLFGLCADMDAIRAVVPEGVSIIEDAACAAGASYRGTPAGALGDAAAFSFHPRKSVTTGEGGMVTTQHAALAETVAMLRNHGASASAEERQRGPRPYLMPDFNLLGFNYRMTDVQAAIGRVQLGKLDRLIAERRQWAEYYRDRLQRLAWLRMPPFPTDGDHAWQAFVTMVDPQNAPMSRNAIMEKLQANGIATRPGTHAVHMLGLYRNRFGYAPDDFPGARSCHDHTMAIPLHNRMTREDYDFVVEALCAI